MAPKVWLITGCSSGFGREIVLAALRQNDRVVATARDLSKLDDLSARGALTFALDVRADDTQLQKVVTDILEVTGQIDILVNNAGYILTGAVEECSRSEVQDAFQTNVFGQLNLIRAVLPHMRLRRSGVVANLGSIGGWAGVPAAGVYCATKAAVTILSEALRLEVQHLGIEVTSIEPGYFRTNFLGFGHRSRAANKIQDLHNGVDETLKQLTAYDQHQPGDPSKGAQIIVEVLTKTGRCEGKTLPPRLALGHDAITYITSVLDKHHQNIDEWKDLVSTTDCDP